jgi:large subunit ribosomal protein L35Ae
VCLEVSAIKVKVLSQPVYGRIMNYRIGIRTQMSRECLIQFVNTDSEAQAGKFIGQKVLWKSGKSELFGKIVGFHGKNGVVRVRFKKGVPGQALGTTVKLVG